MKTGIITTDTYLNHNTGQGHPERADRVTVVIDHLKKLKLKNLIWKKPTKFDLKYLEFAHDKNYLNNVKDSFPKQGLNFLDGDTIVSPGSKDATRDAVGSILTGIDGVMKKDFGNAFCAVRPPGHHALNTGREEGFCYYNNIAIAAKYAQEKYNLDSSRWINTLPKINKSNPPIKKYFITAILFVVRLIFVSVL